ncbi:hypothetical protein [Rhodopirellula europaea]|uniref:Uncharacterized protein n=1 Tax=Rhodopirellula europaea 6C TaxID=1263867 RepID=M2B0L8_9BACT|nr:hypothetical protein [Rhodopirellula europaea]EMB15784.1 hypothetical protein RE6C_03485 [Rhodopirellula europaea 6C]
MHLKLIASVPSKRWDPCRELSADGRGGWVFSQVNVDRLISDYDDYYMLFGLGVLAANAMPNDYVEQTKLIARMGNDVVGTDVLTWKHPNSMWGIHDGDAIFEWAQLIALDPERDGMISVSIDAKIKSQDDWLPVDGNAYCRITRSSECKVEARFVPSFWFTIKNTFRKPFWPNGTES